MHCYIVYWVRIKGDYGWRIRIRLFSYSLIRLFSSHTPFALACAFYLIRFLSFHLHFTISSIFTLSTAFYRLIPFYPPIRIFQRHSRFTPHSPFTLSSEFYPLVRHPYPPFILTHCILPRL